MKMEVDAKALIDEFARLKRIPVSKVLRNMARDLTQAAYKAMPVSVLKNSSFARFGDKEHGYIYVPIEKYARSKKQRTHLLAHRVPMKTGWSKAGWIGVMRSLGMTTKKKPSKIPTAVERIGYSIASGTDTKPVIEIGVDVRFNGFKRGGDRTSRHVLDAGYRLAWKRLLTEYHRILKKQSVSEV